MSRFAVSSRGAVSFLLAVAFLIMPNHGCTCDPPGDGTLLLAIRTWVPEPPRPTLSGGEGETLDGLASLLATVERVDVVHRTDLSDASTESVLTIGEGPLTLELVGALEDASNRAVGEFLVPAGFVLQIRLVTSALTLSIRGEEHSVALTSADESGFKIDPMDEVPFEIRSSEDTAARVVIQPFEQLIRNRGVGFLAKPHLFAEHVDPVHLWPSTIIFDHVIVRFQDGTPQSVIDAEIAAVDAAVLLRWAPTNFYVLKLPATLDAMAALDHFDVVPSVAYAVPDFVMEFYQDDPRYPFQTHWPQADVDAAYAAGFTGTYEPVVAIVDEGVDLDHRDLRDNLWINLAEVNPILTDDADMDTYMDGDFDQDGFLTFADFNDPMLTLAQETFLASVGLVQPVTVADLIAASFDGIDNDCPDMPLCTYIDDVVGWDFRDGDNLPYNDPGDDHGTEMAGIAGAVGNNSLDATGVGWKVRILPIRVDLRAGGPLEGDAVLAAKYAASVGADVINMSFGFYAFEAGEPPAPTDGGVTDGGMRDEKIVGMVTSPGLFPGMVARLNSLLADIHANLNGAMLVTAAGNSIEDHDDPLVYQWPCGDGTNLTGDAAAHVRVAAVDDMDNLWFEVPGYGSDFGLTTVDVAAPGYRFVVLTPGGGVRMCDADGDFLMDDVNCPVATGTSHAAAFFSGVAGLLISADPTLLGQGCALADRLIRNGDFFSALAASINGGFRVNADRAITNVVTTAIRTCP